MPTQIVLFYSGGAADGNRLCDAVAHPNRGNREGWVYNLGHTPPPLLFMLISNIGRMK